MSFKIGEAHRTVPHLIADLVELLLAVKYEGQTRLHHADVSAILANADRSSEELDLEESDQQSSQDDIALEDTWEHLEYRAARLGSAYPFKIDGDFIEIRDTFSAEQRVYLFLLTCSRLRSFNNNFRSIWATAFSELCVFVMRALMPPNAIIRVFDANSNDRKNYYGTDLREALVKLGEDLCAHHIMVDTCKKQSSSGDAQLDIVGVIPFDDAAKGVFAILGQCAAQEKNWPSKRMEAHPANLSGFFNLLPTPSNVCFIPVCYRASNGEWVNEAKATGCLLVDRIRIMSSLTSINACVQITNEPWFSHFETNLPQNIPA